MMETKLNAQVIIKILQNMHEKSLPPTGAKEDGTGVSGLPVGPTARQGTTHRRTQRPPSGVAVVVESRDGQ